MSVPTSPNDWQVTCKQVKERGQYLLECGVWSDCKFVVGTEPNHQVLNGHKLFLAMASPVFEAMFFGGMAEKGTIAILDVQPDAFKVLLQYIYTDKVNLKSFDQACELCYVAKKYMLPHLVEECTKYLWSDLNSKNVCRAYEFAKLFEEPVLMDRCLQIMCDQAQEVLTDPSFDDVEISTILTICDQDVLNISSEVVLFQAISRYAARHSDNAGAKVPRIDGIENPSTEANSSNSNRPTIKDAVKKLRFLSWTPQQFAEIPAGSCLLTQAEKYAILMNICSSSVAVPMPEGFSTCRASRNKVLATINEAFYQESPTSPDVTRLPRKLYCSRHLLGSSECMNTSVLDGIVTFSCDRNICVYGIQIPTQIRNETLSPTYSELLYAHLLDADGSRLTYTHFTSRVPFRETIEISFNRPVYIQKNKMYKIGVVLNKIGWYPIDKYSCHASSDGVLFTFIQSDDTTKDGLIRSIVFTYATS